MSKNIWFTADTHFGHVKIIEFHPERGSSLDEMHERLVSGWNDNVKPNDEIWHLGDFAMGKLDDSLKFFHKLNGKKNLIRGNHDSNRTVNLPWSSVNDLKTFKQKPVRAIMCHYPLLTWDGAHRGTWMLHGHSHGSLGPNDTTRMDVGVDCHPEFRPFHLDEITDILSTKSFKAVDHHQ